MTGVAAGTAVITGKWSYNSSKTVTYTVNVTEIPSGTYFIQNRETEKYVQPDNDDAPNYSNNGGIMEQMDFDALQEYNSPAVPSEVLEKLDALDVETLTPIEALNFLYELKKTLKGSLNG